MITGGRIVFLPGEVSINILDALKVAIEKIRLSNKRLVRVGNFETTKNRLNKLASAPWPSAYTIHPVRYRTIGRPAEETKKEKATRVKRELIDAGITFYGLIKSETRALSKVLHSGEHVEAIVYGQHHSNSVMLVATDERIIFLDKKPMALFMDEVTYDVISGIEFEIHTFFATLVLHTPVKNYDIRYANLRCAERFARHIESRRLNRDQAEGEDSNGGAVKEINHEIRPIHPSELEDMAGYYWLPIPTEEEEKLR